VCNANLISFGKEIISKTSRSCAREQNVLKCNRGLYFCCEIIYFLEKYTKRKSGEREGSISLCGNARYPCKELNAEERELATRETAKRVWGTDEARSRLTEVRIPKRAAVFVRHAAPRVS